MADKPLPTSLKESLDHTKVEYRRLGNSGLRVSVPIFGAMSIGDTQALEWVVNEEEVSSSALPSIGCS